MGFDVVRQPLTAAFVTLLVFATIAMACTENLYPAEESASLLGGYVLQVQTAWPLVAKIVCGLLIVLAGTLLGRATTRYALYPVHTYLVIPLYGMLACGVLVSSGFVVESLAAVLFTFSMIRFYACFRSGAYGFGEIFRASLYLGLIPFIYTPAVVLVVVIPIAGVVFERSVRELLVAAVGLLLPLFALCYLNWAAGGAFSAPFTTLAEVFMTPGGFSVFMLTPWMLGMFGILLLLYLCAGFCYFSDLHIAGSKSRSILLFNLLLFLVAGGMLFVPCASLAVSAFLAVPLSVVLPLLFVRLDRRIAWMLYLGVIFLCSMRFFL